MLVGHVAVGLTAKCATPRVSLGTFILAALLADLLWSIFLVVGVERVQFATGTGAGTYLKASDIAMSHSLLMNTVWASVLALMYFAKSQYRVGAWMLFGVVLSHWVLDWFSHSPDMPLLPGGRDRFGLGLWQSIPATLLIEGGIWIAAVLLYSHCTDARKKSGVYVLWGGVVVLTVAWYNNIAGPPPNPRVAGIASFVFFALIVGWAYWLESIRDPQYHSNRAP
jgi:hypothetical protein